MKKTKVFFLIICLFLLFGCKKKVEEKPIVETKIVTKEESQAIAEQQVKSSEKFVSGNGQNLVLAEVMTANCTSCWSFRYQFDYQTETTKKAELIVSVREGNIVSTIITEDSKITPVNKKPTPQPTAQPSPSNSL